MRSIILFALALLFIHPYCYNQHPMNGRYSRTNNGRVAFPVGGMGAGMFCLEGTGAVSHMSIRHHPEVFSEPVMFGALYVKG